MSANTLPKLKGITAQPDRAKKKVKTGANTKMPVFALLGTINSLVNSFKPSDIGCNIPQKPTTLGPLRRCIAAIILRSAKVKKATESIIGTTRIKDNTKVCSTCLSIILIWGYSNIQEDEKTALSQIKKLKDKYPNYIYKMPIPQRSNKTKVLLPCKGHVSFI
jgi:hypothetical protein